MNKWDVVLLRFPFSDYSATKVRPAVIISPNSYHQHGDDVLVMLITSNVARQSQYDVIVTATHPEFRESGLRKDSAIRTSKITTIHKSAVRAQLGSLGNELVKQVVSQLRSFLDLPPTQAPLPGMG